MDHHLPGGSISDFPSVYVKIYPAVKDSSDGRSPLAVALEWSSRITVISLQMVLPGLFGYWLDQRFGTKVVFLILGIFFGLASGLWSLIRLAQEKR